MFKRATNMSNFHRSSLQVTGPLYRKTKSESMSLNGPLFDYKILNINYSNLINEIFDYYCSDRFIDSPLLVQFIYQNKEIVRKSSFEMFISFWDFLFERYFLGKSGSFVPRVDLNGDCLTMKQSIGLGKIISHGFSLTGYLPINGICKASLIYCMTGKIPSDKILLNSYLQSIDESDREYIEEALLIINNPLKITQYFSKELEADLVEFFHASNLKAIPKMDNLKELLLKSAIYYCIQKPFFVLANIRLGILTLQPNWQNLSEEMALIFMNTCHNTGQCQPEFDLNDNLSDAGSERSARSVTSNLFRN